LPSARKRGARNLERQGERISNGKTFNTTIISAPSSTKNQKTESEPDMHQTVEVE
jgi:hypothetical protein